MNVEIRPEVATDLAIAADWCDQREPGLGDEFMTEYRNTLAATIDKPLDAVNAALRHWIDLMPDTSTGGNQ
jgi:hypothetical protein